MPEWGGCVVQVPLKDTRAQESNCLSVLSVPKLLTHPGFLQTHTHTHTHTRTHIRARTHTPGFLRNPVEKWQDSSCHPASLPFSALPPTPVMGVRKDSPFEKAAASGGLEKGFSFRRHMFGAHSLPPTIQNLPVFAVT